MKLNPLLVQDLKRTYDEMAGALTIDPRSRLELERILQSKVLSGEQLVKKLAQVVLQPRAAAPAAAAAEEDLDFGTVVGPATGKVRALSREDSELGVHSIRDKSDLVRASSGDSTRSDS
jgi:hypothetical protein